MDTPNIQSLKRVVPMIYAYTTPGVAFHEGWTKIGYTEKQSVDQRIKQQPTRQDSSTTSSGRTTPCSRTGLANTSPIMIFMISL